MLTPFNDDLTIDWPAVDSYTDWLIDRGAAGLFPVALSGEMYELSPVERRAIAERVVERSAGRVPVIASVVESGSAELYAVAAAELAATGVDAVVLIASMILEEGEDESGLRDKVQVILDANPGVQFGVYECPLPYHRILSTPLVEWLARTGRFVFFKETSHDVELMAQRVAVASGTPMRVFNAGIETLVDSLAVGVSGLSGWVVNLYPEQVAWLCANAAQLDRETALQAQNALEAVERGMGPSYPNSAKFLLAGRSAEFSPVSRWRATEIDTAALVLLAAEFDARQLPGLIR